MWYVSAPFLVVVAVVRMPSYVLSCSDHTQCAFFVVPEGRGERTDDVYVKYFKLVIICFFV